MLSSAIVLLFAAMLNPSIPLPHNIYTYMFVVDISQSMNVKDAVLDNKTVSRLDFTKRIMHDITANLPCGTKVSIGLFAGVSVAALYQPIEVVCVRVCWGLPGLCVPFLNPPKWSFLPMVKKPPSYMHSIRVT
jgi:hypothetical protein